ncbi:uncharacterized protein LOC132388553 [Hypanus sabinus]|uniref:uncharacterized protein LOC132388553 n=1 Tax=Hypanus sabinus TaxID=79690 RepID=UPI0028C436DE|nr:uncharacterized protein LOC132388553 [Hypanus sabinus]
MKQLSKVEAVRRGHRRSLCCPLLFTRQKKAQFCCSDVLHTELETTTRSRSVCSRLVYSNFAVLAFTPWVFVSRCACAESGSTHCSRLTHSHSQLTDRRQRVTGRLISPVPPRHSASNHTPGPCPGSLRIQGHCRGIGQTAECPVLAHSHSQLTDRRQRVTGRLISPVPPRHSASNHTPGPCPGSLRIQGHCRGIGQTAECPVLAHSHSQLTDRRQRVTGRLISPVPPRHSTSNHTPGPCPGSLRIQGHCRGICQFNTIISAGQPNAPSSAEGAKGFSPGTPVSQTEPRPPGLLPSGEFPGVSRGRVSDPHIRRKWRRRTAGGNTSRRERFRDHRARDRRQFR